MGDANKSDYREPCYAYGWTRVNQLQIVVGRRPKPLERIYRRNGINFCARTPYEVAKVPSRVSDATPCVHSIHTARVPIKAEAAGRQFFLSSSGCRAVVLRETYKRASRRIFRSPVLIFSFRFSFFFLSLSLSHFLRTGFPHDHTTRVNDIGSRFDRCACAHDRTGKWNRRR